MYYSVVIRTFADIFEIKMRKSILLFLVSVLMLTSCGDYNNLLKSTDYQYKYEAAKAYYLEGRYNKAITLLGDMITILKGSTQAEESLYMLAMCYYGNKDWQEASTTFKKYYRTYTKGVYTELAYFYSCKALYNDTPEARLDQSSTYEAISDIQLFCELYPASPYKEAAMDMMFKLQDKLVDKEYLSAKLYYDLGNYLGNNYLSCVITAQNALRDFPYTSRREDLSWLVLRAKYEMAEQSVEEKQLERYRDTIDEYYAYKNEYPEGKYMKDAEKIFANSTRKVEKATGGTVSEEE